MAEQIILYTNPMSRGRIAHWMLEEIGEPYEARLLDFESGEHKAPEYLKVNPMGKVPAITHRGTVVTESAAICAYLADAFPQKGLAPAPGDTARGEYYRWLFFGAGCVEPAFVDKLFERPKVNRPGALGYGSYEDTVATLEKAVSSGFLAGGRFSAADVYVASQIGWGFIVKALEPTPALQAYVERCTDRPGFKRFMLAADEQVKQLKARKG